MVGSILVLRAFLTRSTQPHLPLFRPGVRQTVLVRDTVRPRGEGRGVFALPGQLLLARLGGEVAALERPKRSVRCPQAHEVLEEEELVVVLPPGGAPALTGLGVLHREVVAQVLPLPPELGLWGTCRVKGPG